MRFACGTRTGSPATVRSPRTGSAMIWAACRPSAQLSDRTGPLACGAAAGDLPPWGALAADGWRLRNQFDVGGLAACTGSRRLGLTGADTAKASVRSAWPFEPNGRPADWPFVSVLSAML